MATQRLSLDPKLWARIRRTAFDSETSATALIATVMGDYLDRLDGEIKFPTGATKNISQTDRKPRSSQAADQPAPRKDNGGPMPWDPPLVFGDSRPQDRPVIGDPFYWNDPGATEGMYVRQSTTVDEALLAAWDRLDVTKVGRAAIVEEAQRIREGREHRTVRVGAVITSATEAADVVAGAAPPMREFHPVPKPTFRKKTNRRTGKAIEEADEA